MVVRRGDGEGDGLSLVADRYVEVFNAPSGPPKGLGHPGLTCYAAADLSGLSVFDLVWMGLEPGLPGVICIQVTSREMKLFRRE
jgi:hypothetical protein